MPSVDPRELGAPSEHMKCRRVGCARLACKTGHGFDLPFCAPDMRLLPLKTFKRLVAVADHSVFDIDGVSEAAAAVAFARLELRTKLAKPVRAARKR